jgi:hypothetical protein
MGGGGMGSSCVDSIGSAIDFAVPFELEAGLPELE